MTMFKLFNVRLIWYLFSALALIYLGVKGWELIEVQSNIPNSLDQGMLAYFDFDGDVEDGSASRNRAVIRRATYTDGKFGQGILFTGEPSSYVEIANPASLSNRDGLTFAAWANVHSNMTWHSSLIYISGETPTRNGFKDRVFTFWPTINGGAHLTSTPEGASAQVGCEVPDGSYMHNEFVHFAGVIDAVNQRMQIYINGEKISQCPYPGSQIRGGNRPIRLGGYFRTVADQSGLTGVLDEVRLYNRALTESEIKALFNLIP